MGNAVEKLGHVGGGAPLAGIELPSVPLIDAETDEHLDICPAHRLGTHAMGTIGVAAVVAVQGVPLRAEVAPAPLFHDVRQLERIGRIPATVENIVVEKEDRSHGRGHHGLDRRRVTGVLDCQHAQFLDFRHVVGRGRLGPSDDLGGQLVAQWYPPVVNSKHLVIRSFCWWPPLSELVGAWGLPVQAA
jgi:hypothetical protein